MRWLVPLLALALMLPASGCANRSPVEAWQKYLEHYVEIHGHGNPAVLAELAPHPARRTFDHIGDREGVLFPKRTDAYGLLVGHRRVDGELWFIYMLGIVRDQGGVVDVNFDRPMVKAVQPVAFAHDPEGFRWVVGESDQAMLQRYLAPQRERWSRSHPDRTAANMTYARFPRPYDRFELAGAARTVEVRHPDSGARWALELPEP